MDDILVFRTGLLGTWREKFAGVADFARTAGWRLHPVDARSARPDVAGLTALWRPIGAIIDASGAPGRLVPEDFGNLPAVFMTPSAAPGGRPPAASVASDSRKIAETALSELLSTAPASLLFVDWFEDCEWAAAKRKCTIRIAAMHGLPIRIVSPTRDEMEDAAALERRVSAALSLVPKPCGAFAVTDTLGAVVISAAAGMGLDVPGDVSVVAVDDDPEVCENTAPTLSSVRPDFHRLGFAAGTALMRLLRGAGAPDGGAADAPRHYAGEQIVVPPAGIVRRASTRTTRRRDRMAERALELIRRKACEGLRPAEVAGVFGVSRRMAEIRFKAATGRTIGEEILETRLTAACDLLKAGRTSVGAIANFCGWSGDLAFRKAFKSRYGTPPLKWARKARSGRAERTC